MVTEKTVPPGSATAISGRKLDGAVTPGDGEPPAGAPLRSDDALGDPERARERLGERRVVGDDDDGRPAQLVRAAQVLDHRVAPRHVEPRRWARRRAAPGVRSTSRWRSRPAAAVRRRSGGPAGRAIDPSPNVSISSSPDQRSGHPRRRAPRWAKRDVLQRRRVGQQVLQRVLEQERELGRPQSSEAARVQARHVVLADDDRAGGRLQQPTEQREQRRLARPDGPITASISPARTCNSTLRSATIGVSSPW